MRRSQRVILSLAIASVALIFGFNNCSKMTFSATQALIEEERERLSSTSGILIDNGAEFSNQKVVQLTLMSSRATQMKLSAKADCSDGTWEAYTSAKTWPVTNANEKLAVHVQYKDIVGNISDCGTDDIMHDDVPPTAAFVNQAGAFTGKENITISWSANDNISGIGQTVCKDPSGTPAACTDSINVTTPQEGGHSIQVKVIDRAGNETPFLVYNWVLDKTPPTLVINSQPATVTGSTDAKLQFSGSDSGSGIAGYSCKKDGAAAVPCTSPVSYADLPNGTHSFEVYATDKVGNKSVVAKADWRVDTTAPDVRFTQTPASDINTPIATLAFVATDDGVAINKFECSLDSSVFASCLSPLTLNNLAAGLHEFQVRAVDASDNRSSAISHKWTVDMAPPTLAFTVKPSSPSNLTSVNFQWTAKDDNGLKEVTCRLDGANFIDCPGLAKILNGVSVGDHTFQIQATDLAGNIAIITHTWTTDLTAPLVTITAKPPLFDASIAAKFEFSATDASGIAGYECRLDSALYTPCSSPLNLGSLSEDGHVLYVRAKDNAGNVSIPATYAWTIDQSPPLIRILSAPSTISAGTAVSISYDVIDTSSGLASVKCGLNSSTHGLSDCEPKAVTSLGVLNTDGQYVFEIQATDKVGNSVTEIVNIIVTPRPIVCDPFSSAGEMACSGGLIGDIYYLTTAQKTNFNRTADYFYNFGTKVDAVLNLDQLAVSTRPFSGFPLAGGGFILNNSGQKLSAYFAFRLKTVVKLDPTINQPGWYQFATISDDGSIVNVLSGNNVLRTLIGNDGDHSTKMGCSANAVYISDSTRLPLEVKYYQGPEAELAMMLLWRKVSSETSPLDESCNYVSITDYFGPSFNDFTNRYRYGQLVDRGWKVLAPTNFIAPSN